MLPPVLPRRVVRLDDEPVENGSRLDVDRREASKRSSPEGSIPPPATRSALPPPVANTGPLPGRVRPASKERITVSTWVWIVIIVVVLIAILGYRYRGRLSR